MSEFRVPTRAVEAKLRYFDERPLRGRVFIPSSSQRHDGSMRIDEWMNQASGFFPFIEDGQESARLLNKRYVVVLTLDDHEPDIPSGASARRVVVECGTLRIEGTVYVEMPDHASRLLDWLNNADAFLVIHADGERHVVQKQRITSLFEVQEV